MRSRNWSEKTSEKMSAPMHAAADAPAPEDDEGHAHPAAAGDDVEREAAEQREREERAADGHQRAAEHQRQVARPGHVDAGGVRRLRVLAHGADLEAEARSLKEPPRGRDDDQEGDPGQSVLVEDRADPAQRRRTG